MLALTDLAARGLADLGMAVVSSRRRGETSSIVTAVPAGRTAWDLVRELGERNVVVAARAGRLRIAPHFYNTAEEIERCLEEVAKIL